jgi:hypothetical protein
MTTCFLRNVAELPLVLYGHILGEKLAFHICTIYIEIVKVLDSPPKTRLIQQEDFTIKSSKAREIIEDFCFLQTGSLTTTKHG